MKILGEGGGYIAAPTHDVPGDVPPKNLEAMVKAFLCQ
jgi:uroporphyrinogen-III decarboxylase